MIWIEWGGVLRHTREEQPSRFEYAAEFHDRRLVVRNVLDDLGAEASVEGPGFVWQTGE